MSKHSGTWDKANYVLSPRSCPRSLDHEIIHISVLVQAWRFIKDPVWDQVRIEVWEDLVFEMKGSPHEE